jgi:hypothetical protein
MSEESAVATKKETTIESVTMEDGRIVDFPGKKRLQKESFVAADGSITVRCDFRNGRSLSYTQSADDPLRPKSAAHGLEQKLGDETAGETDLDDAFLAVESLIGRLQAGEWTIKREGSGMSGTSVLLKAIVQVTSKPIEAVKKYLSGLTQPQKMALRDSPKFRDAVAAIEAEKAKAKKPVDISKELEEIDAI